MTNTNKLPTTFMVIGIVAIIWNLLGLAAFFSDIMMSSEALAALPEDQQELYQNNPLWMKIVYGIATISGVLGSIGLLMKKAWSVPVFLVSLIAVVIQMGYSTFVSNAGEVMGPMIHVMTALVLLIAVFLWYYAKKAVSRGWLN